MRAVRAVYLVELTKLAAQVRVWIVAAAVLVAPWLSVLLIRGQDRLPNDTLYGRYITTVGLAVPLLILGFLASWGFPLLTALVSGDIFSSEEQQGTLKTILTRSVNRRAVFTGKVLASFTYSLAIVALLAGSALAAGLAVVGTQPLQSLAGTSIPPGRGIGLVALAWAIAALPFLGFACLSMLISVLSRNSVIGVLLPIVIGFVMQFYAFLNGKDIVRHNLLTTPFMSWHGLFDDPQYFAPLLRGLAVSLAYGIVCLAVANRVVSRRDVTGG